MPSVGPFAVETRMSDYGYWVVTVSTSPGRRISVMICQVGITPTQARSLALTGVTHVLGRKG